MTKSGNLIAGKYNKKELSELGAIEGLSFGPPLIVNGEKMIHNGDGGWGISPRTAIGQRKDGTILFLVIDGRQPGYSIGASLADVQNIMYEQGAYIAANLDGGSSTTLYFNGQVVNKPADLLGERMIPTAFYCEVREAAVKQGLQKVLLCFGAGILVQGGAYFYLDQVLFAPASDYNVSDINKSDQTAKADKEAFAGVKLQGKPYYSHDYRYMADVSDTSVTIYDAKNLGSPQVADLKGQGVSFFEWLPDRNLALMALYPAHWKGGRWNVTLARYNPDSPNHESDAPVDDLPKNSKIVG